MKILKKIKEIVNSFFNSFLSGLARSIAENGGELLVRAAREAVAAAEQSGGSGEDKLKAARDRIISSLRDAGKPIVMNAINGAIEAAVAEMKK
jgi:hypothetical protein